jgi:hypothetical protein
MAKEECSGLISMSSSFAFLSHGGCPVYIYDSILMCNIPEFLSECSLFLEKLFFHVDAVYKQILLHLLYVALTEEMTWPSVKEHKMQDISWLIYDV